MANNPLVSVIINFYNSGRFITETIESVIQQTYKNWELLLIDDGSSDDSTAIAKSYSLNFPNSIKYFEHENHLNRGPSVSRNLGIKMARGDYVAFLDSDDIWYPNKLTDQIEIFSRYSELGMVYGNSLNWFSWTGRDIDKSKDNVRISSLLLMSPRTIYNPPDLLTILLKNPRAVPCTSTIMVKKEIIDLVGGFNEDFGITYDDQGFFAKVISSYKTYVSNECWIKYRIHESSITSKTLKTGETLVCRLNYLVWLKHYIKCMEITDKAIMELVLSDIKLTNQRLLDRLDKTHSKIKRLEKSISQQNKILKKLKSETNLKRINLLNIVLKLRNNILVKHFISKLNK